MEKKVDKNLVDNKDTLTFSFYVVNQKSNALTNIVVTDTLDNELMFVNNSSSISSNLLGNILTFDLGDLASGQDTVFSYQTIALSSKPYTPPIFMDDIEGDVSDYTIVERLGSAGWETTTQNSLSPPTAWFVPNIEANNNHSLRTPLFSPTENTLLSFWHNYHTEANYDGGVVEILASGRWQDLEDNMWVNPYDNILGAGTELGERRAFGGNSQGWVQTVIDLREYAGINTFISFNFGSDTLSAEQGWYIDDISIQDRVFVSRSACVSANEGDNYCAELKLPVAILINDLASSLPELPNEVAIKLYPNPAQKQLNLVYQGDRVELLEVNFRNTLGQLVKAFEMKPFASNSSKQIDISKLPAGIYYVSIRQGDSRTIKILLVR